MSINNNLRGAQAIGGPNSSAAPNEFKYVLELRADARVSGVAKKLDVLRFLF